MLTLEPLEHRFLFASVLQPDFRYGADGNTPIFTNDQSRFDTHYDAKDRALRVIGEELSPFLYTPPLVVQRLTSSGRLDRSFADRGTFRVDLSGRLDVAFQADGKILIACNSQSGLFVLRLTESGALDPTFGNAGQTTTPTSDYRQRPLIHVPDDGNIIVAHGQQVTRVSPLGQIVDTRNFELPNNVSAFWKRFHVDAAGRLYVQYYDEAEPYADEVNFLLRLRDDLTPDPIFGVSGVAEIGLFQAASVYDDPIATVQFQPGGGFLVTGYPGNAERTTTTVTRFNDDGTRDNTFAAGTGALVGWGISAIDPRSGRLFGGSDGLMMRLRPDGVRDRTFPTQSGVSIHAVSPGGTVFGWRQGVYLDGPVRLVLAPEAVVTPGNVLQVYGSLRSDRIDYAGSTLRVNESTFSFDPASFARIRVIGGGGDDRVVLDVATPTDVRMGDGNDTIATAAGNDTIEAGEGDDFISSGSGHDTLHGDIGNDTILAGGGRDTTESGFGDDLVYGGGGNDAISNHEGADTIYAGKGNDSIRASATGSGGETIDLGDGNDRVTFPDGTRATIFGGPGDDHVSTGARGYAIFYGGRGNDILDESERDAYTTYPGSDLFDDEGVNRVLRNRR